ncbi:hypothetical protein [Hyphococcus sp.]|uniref:hypothetical protein n=1 Tax=Hyphococcus sp. TaxID=2038636 RepID=UPI003CCBFE5D
MKPMKKVLNLATSSAILMTVSTGAIAGGDVEAACRESAEAAGGAWAENIDNGCSCFASAISGDDELENEYLAHDRTVETWPTISQEIQDVAAACFPGT